MVHSSVAPPTSMVRCCCTLSLRESAGRAAIRCNRPTLRLLASRKNHRVVLTDDPKSAVDLTLGDAKSTLHLEQSESTLNGEQKLTVTGATIEIKASQKLVIEAPQIEMTARAELKVAGKPIRLN